MEFLKTAKNATRALQEEAPAQALAKEQQKETLSQTFIPL